MSIQNIACGFLFLALINSCEADGIAAADFSTIVQENFTNWDSDADGVLSKEEIYTAAENPEVTGAAAAVIATLIHYERNPKFTLPPITMKYLVETADHTVKQGNSQDDNTSGENQIRFEKTYRRICKKIGQTSPILFPQDIPIFSAVHQGSLGDCPFVSTVGALVYRNPADIKAMFEQQPNGNIVVRFGDGKKIKMKHPTDTDVGIWSSAGTNGLWFTALEKAYRTVLVADKHPNRGSRPNIFDKFGPSLYTVEIMDGFSTENILLRKAKPGSLKLAPLRKRLESVIKAHRIVKTGTSSGVHPAGVPSGHAFAVLGYSREDDMVQVWNPWGQEFKPNGPEGMENGYETKRGMFNVPLKEFVQIFDNLKIETKVRTQL